MLAESRAGQRPASPLSCSLPRTPGGEPRGTLNLPAGWSIERNELVWTSATPLRMGGARYEFRSGDQLLGYPATRGNALRLPLRSSGRSPSCPCGREAAASTLERSSFAFSPRRQSPSRRSPRPRPTRQRQGPIVLSGCATRFRVSRSRATPSGGSGRGGDCSHRQVRPTAARSLSPRTAQHLLSRRPRRRGVGRLALPDGMAPGPEPHRIPVHHRCARHSGIPDRVDFRERHQRSGRPVHRRGRVGALAAGPPPSRPVVGLGFRRWRPLGRALSWPRRHG